jgi:hypothetical protein
LYTITHERAAAQHPFVLHCQAEQALADESKVDLAQMSSF